MRLLRCGKPLSVSEMGTKPDGVGMTVVSVVVVGHITRNDTLAEQVLFGGLKWNQLTS